MYTANLYSNGNPDLGQFTPVSDRESVQAETLEDIRTFARDYIRRWDLGSGNWPLPMVYENGKSVGGLAYNMQIVGT
jgi:hypothetical protein